MAGVLRTKLNNLNINLKNALIVGIIVAKNSPRIIGSKKKNGDARGVTSFTLRDSNVDTINVDVWGSEYFIITFYERFLVGDVVEISSPKICVKGGDNELWRPQVSSPFYLSLNEGFSDVTIHTGDSFSLYLPLLHLPTKPASGYHGLAEVMKLPERTGNVYVDVLVVVRSVKPARTIKTKAGMDMTVRSVEIVDNTTPACMMLDMFDIDTIQRKYFHYHGNRGRKASAQIKEIKKQAQKMGKLADEPHDVIAESWRALESVLFVADARVRWSGGGGPHLQLSCRTVVTHQPHTADAEALLLYIRNQANTVGGEAAAWAAWSGERSCAATVAQVRDRLRGGGVFCASLHAMMTWLDLEHTGSSTNDSGTEEMRVRFADHTGELNARIPVNILEEALGLKPEELKTLSSDDKTAIRWRLLLEQCSVKIAVSPPRLIVLGLRRATSADPIPLY